MAKALPFIVECRSFYTFFEPIAAFNVESAALAYAFECQEGSPSFKYRVRKGSRILGSNEHGVRAAA